MFFILKSPPPGLPPTMYLLQPGLTHVVHGKLPGFVQTPDMYMYKIKTKIKKFKCLKVQMLHKHPATLPQSTPKKVLLVLPLMSLE